MRGFLSCSADYTAPCLGFDGDCGDLAEQFKDVPDSGIPDDYECTQFPDEKSARDKIIIGARPAPASHPASQPLLQPNRRTRPLAQASSASRSGCRSRWCWRRASR